MVTPPDRSAGSVLVRSFLYFAAGFAGAFALAFFVAGIWRENASAAPVPFARNLAMAGYILFLTVVSAAAGFAIVTSPWTSWRSLPPARLAWLSVAAGVLAYASQLTGLIYALTFPLPGGFGAFASALRLLLPGLAAGLAMVAAVALLRREPVPRA